MPRRRASSPNTDTAVLMTEPRFCRLDRGWAWGLNPRRRSAFWRSQCSRTHRACSSTTRTGSDDSSRSRVQGCSPATSAGSNALRTAAGSSEACIGDGAPVEGGDEPVTEGFDRGPGKRLVEAQADLPEIAARLAVHVHDLPDPPRDVPVEPLAVVEAVPFVEEARREAVAQAETSDFLHRVEQGHRFTSADYGRDSNRERYCLTIQSCWYKIAHNSSPNNQILFLFSHSLGRVVWTGSVRGSKWSSTT